jgi:hypothetical protein
MIIRTITIKERMITMAVETLIKAEILEEMETLMVAIGNRCFLSQLCHFTL